MNNYEIQQKEIDAILEKGHNIAVNKNTNKVMDCQETSSCNDCLFFEENFDIDCNVYAVEWAGIEDEECDESKIDWSKIPVDTPVIVSNNKWVWDRRYFAGVNEYGTPLTFADGRTSWSDDDKYFCEIHNYIKLVGLPDSPENEE